MSHVKQALSHSLFWYVSPPQDILAALRRVHGMDSRKKAPGATAS
jgi:hypothetical protein